MDLPFIVDIIHSKKNSHAFVLRTPLFGRQPSQPKSVCENEVAL